jgi:hypothetical protein
LITQNQLLQQPLYKGLLNALQCVIAGRILVRQDAQKTNRFSQTKIFCSRHKQRQFQPQLEIFADDVKCTHGATSGQLVRKRSSIGAPAESANSMLKTFSIKLSHGGGGKDRKPGACAIILLIHSHRAEKVCHLKTLFSLFCNNGNGVEAVALVESR